MVDFAIHVDGTAHNPHLHVLLTTRVIDHDGFGGKIRAADGRQFVENARALWARLANEAMAKAGVDSSIDPRSHAKAGVDRTPTKHRGPNAVERRFKRDAMALSRLLKPKFQEDGEAGRALEAWPASQAQVRMTDDASLPVPSPGGGLISQMELEQAQKRMLDQMESRRTQATPASARRWGEGSTLESRATRETPLASRRWGRGGGAGEGSPDHEPAEAPPGRRWGRHEELNEKPDRETTRD